MPNMKQMIVKRRLRSTVINRVSDAHGKNITEDFNWYVWHYTHRYTDYSLYEPILRKVTTELQFR